MALIDEGIRTQAAPLGIVSFELCAYTDSCAQILQSWNSHARQLATLSLGIDYLFMVLYPATLFVSLLLMVPRVPQNLQEFTRWSAWGAWGMGVADALENYCLTQMVLTESVQGLAWPAAVFASIKFAILIHTLVWLAFTWLAYVLVQPAKPKIA